MENKYGEPYNPDEEDIVDSSLKDIILELRQGETIVFDVGDNEPGDSDEIFDTLVMKGFNVKKTFLNGRHSVIVSK